MEIWLEDKKEETKFDSKNNKTLIIGFSWNEELLSWVNLYKIDYAYNENDSLISKSNNYWDVDKGIWSGTEFDSKLEYVYDNIGNKLQQTTYSWDFQNDKWGNYKKYDFYFSNKIKHEDIVYPNQSQDAVCNNVNVVNPPLLVGLVKYGHSKLTHFVNYDTDFNDDWKHSDSTIYYYSDFIINSVDEIKNNFETEINIFPNPVSEIITLEIKNENISNFQYEILDITGNKILEGTLVNSLNINVSNLSKGTYILKFNSKSQKFIKE